MFWISVLGVNHNMWGGGGLRFSGSEALSPGEAVCATAAVFILEVSIRGGNVDRRRLCEVAA